MRDALISNMLGLIGGVIGGVVGYYIVGWLAGQSFYGMMIPGALIGLGCNLLAGRPSVSRGIVCGVAAVAFGLFCEWKLFPWLADDSLRYFLAHIRDLKPITFLMIGLGGAFAFWMGKDARSTRTKETRPAQL